MVSFDSNVDGRYNRFIFNYAVVLNHSGHFFKCFFKCFFLRAFGGFLPRVRTVTFGSVLDKSLSTFKVTYVASEKFDSSWLVGGVLWKLTPLLVACTMEFVWLRNILSCLALMFINFVGLPGAWKCWAWTWEFFFIKSYDYGKFCMWHLQHKIVVSSATFGSFKWWQWVDQARVSVTY